MRTLLRLIAIDRYCLPLLCTMVYYTWLGLVPMLILILKYNFMLNKVLWHGPHKKVTRYWQGHVFIKDQVSELIIDDQMLHTDRKDQTLDQRKQTMDQKNQINPHELGLIQGHLLYPEMQPLIRRFKVLRPFLRLFFKTTLANIPIIIEEEIRGLITAYNQHVKWYDQLTYEQALEYHMLVDQWIACSVIVHQIDQKTYIGRNMDFSPFGSGGSDSVLIRMHKKCYLTVPGFVGLISAWKETLTGPMCCFLNISYAGKRTKKSIITPITFNAKKIFEEVTSIYQVKNKEYTGLPCHLTFVGQNYYYQKNTGIDDERIEELTNQAVVFKSEQTAQYWTTFNYSYPFHFGNARSSNSRDRATAVHLVMCVNPFNKMNAMLAITHDMLNVPDTIHSFYIDLDKKELYLSCDNGFAADGPFVRLPLFNNSM